MVEKTISNIQEVITRGAKTLIVTNQKMDYNSFDEIMALLAMVPKSKLPVDYSIEEAQRLYLAQKVAEIKRRESEKKIRSKFLYLKKMIEKDVYNNSKGQQNNAVAKGTQVFQNFTERQDNNYSEKIMNKLKSDLKEFQENQSC